MTGLRCQYVDVGCFSEARCDADADRLTVITDAAWAVVDRRLYCRPHAARTAAMAIKAGDGVQVLAIPPGVVGFCGARRWEGGCGLLVVSIDGKLYHGEAGRPGTVLAGNHEPEVDERRRVLR